MAFSAIAGTSHAALILLVLVSTHLHVKLVSTHKLWGKNNTRLIFRVLDHSDFENRLNQIF